MIHQSPHFSGLIIDQYGKKLLLFGPQATSVSFPIAFEPTKDSKSLVLAEVGSGEIVTVTPTLEVKKIYVAETDELIRMENTFDQNKEAPTKADLAKRGLIGAKLCSRLVTWCHNNCPDEVAPIMSEGLRQSEVIFEGSPPQASINLIQGSKWNIYKLIRAKLPPVFCFSVEASKPE
jgi:hypothetical protein